MRVFYSVIICMVMAFSSFSQTNWTGAVDSDFFNAANWNNGVPTSGVLATITSTPQDPVIGTDLVADFTLQLLDTLYINADFNNDASIVLFGNGVLVNNGVFTNNPTKFINNNGVIINNNIIENNGTIQSNGAGVLINKVDANFNNNIGAALNNFASVANDGTFTNDGNIANCNVIFNTGLFTNNGPLNQGENGIFNNLPDALFANNSAIQNSGAINNEPNATLVNEGVITNNSNGTINNEGEFDNNGTVTNAGTFNNSGSLLNSDLFTNDFGATLLNIANVENESCATFRQFSANPIACTLSCSFTNNGILFQIPGAGNVTITAGSGIVLNDINTLPSPSANCQSATVILDENGEGSIMVSDIDDNSSADYCMIAGIEINTTDFTCANIGSNIVTLTITDDLGFSNFCTATVTVTDNSPPVINNCPSSITINLLSGECEGIATFLTPTAVDNCGATISRTDNTGLNSGDAFPIGSTTIAYVATDGSSSEACSFEITVNEFVPASSFLNCVGGVVSVSLSENCDAIVLPDDFLIGEHYHCFDDYTVGLFFDMAMTQPVPTSPVLTSQNIGQELIVSVTDTETGNSCWGRIQAEDYIAPSITCEDLSITCFDDSSPQTLGFPASFDNCDSGLFPTYIDEEIDNGCEDSFILRNWTVTDFSGNSDACQQVITITRPGLADVVFPENLDNIENPALNCSSNPNTNPDHTGYPTINGNIIGNEACNFSSTYDDQILPICEGTYKIVRNWLVNDWCTSELITEVQIIKVVDATGPALTCPNNIETSTNLNSCVASVILPQPVIQDDCSSTSTTTVTSSAGDIVNGVLINLPVGIHTVAYQVLDACGNESTCSFTVTVTDEIPPIAVCETTHTVALTIDEPTLIPALVFDDGSLDNCSDLIYEVRRMDAAQCTGFDGTPFGPYAPFYCCDVSDVVMVELRVTDVSNNTNSCMIEVTVQDKLDPIISCPPTAELDCYDDFTDLTLTGEATAIDNCGVTLSHTDNGDIDNCGGGTINRIWTATDPGDRTASCVQQIIVDNSTPFYITDTECNNANPNDGVIWPCDYDADGCAAITDPSTTGEPIIIEDGCDLVAVTYEDIELPITEPACMKVIRVWTVVDWCQYEQDNTTGQWTYNQIIKILNTTAPEFTSDCEDQSFCSYEADCGDAPVQLIASAADDCTSETDLRFNYEIDLGNNGSVNISGEGNDASGDFSLGTHSIKWLVEDGCGNVNTCEYLFVVSDCKKPTPYCINGLAVDLMPNVNEVTLWANDFNQGSFDNCGINEFRAASPSQGPGQTIPPDEDNVVFNCSDVGTQTVDMWVSDINGNWDYCSTYIIVQDNAGNCGDVESASVAGSIQNEAGEMVESVMVYIGGDAPGIPDPNMTGVDGEYAFPGLVPGGNYMIQPEKDEDPLNGVSTLDLVLMKRHILGIQYLNSPYKMIAADINKSGSISTFDLVKLRRLILQVDDNFTDNTSWRFVPADFVFPDPGNPFATAFPEVLDIDGLDADVQGDFVAVKTGDVNGNAAANNFSGNGDDRNNENPMIFTAKDEVLNPGRSYQIDFKAGDINKIFGYQFTLNFDTEKLNFINIIPGELPSLDLANFGLSKLSEGAITTSWNQSNDFDELDEQAVLFSLVFEAKEQVTWSEALAIASRYTRAEAYHVDLDLLNVELVFETSASLSLGFEIYPNQPNPFMKETLISFSLPEASPLNFTIQDVSGKVIQTQEIDAVGGYNEIQISKDELSGPGVYFYTIKTNTHRVSKRMILIKE